MKETSVKNQQLVMMKLTEEGKIFIEKNMTQAITTNQLIPSNISIRKLTQIFVLFPA